MIGRSSLVTIVAALCALAFPVASAPAVELCAALDGSGSIVIFGGEDFSLQLEGLAAAVEDGEIIPRNGSVTLSVVLFGAWSEVAVPPTVVDSAGTALALAERIRGIPPNLDEAFWHRTNLVEALGACLSQFRDPGEEWIIDISTDGRDNVNDPALVLQARDDAVLLGLDVLNGIGIGTADMGALGSLAWPQPASPPPEEGFVIYVPDFPAYVGAMQEKVRLEVALPVTLDVKPRSCPNPLNIGRQGILPAAVVGTADFDVSWVDPSSVRLAGQEPLRWDYEDVTSPADPDAPLDSCLACSEEGPDGIPDLTLKFDSLAVAAALGAPPDGSCLVVEATGSLKEEYGGRPIRGVDIVVAITKK